MASFTCHVVCVTKRLRLERLVRPPHPELAPDLATAQPLRRTLQQVWPNGLRLALAGTKAGNTDSRGQELSLRLARSRAAAGLTTTMPAPRVRGANAATKRGATDRLESGNNSAGNKA